MNHDSEDIDRRLARLAGATAGVRPRAGFSAEVMSRITRERALTVSALGAPARRFFPIGMLAAAMALVWAVSVDDQVAEAIAINDDTELTSW
jgi:hypothetical protein